MPRLSFTICEDEISYTAIRSQGAGGQNVNKVATAIELRFAVTSSSLPEALKQKLLLLADRRINKAGVLVIKAQQERTQEANRKIARERLEQVIEAAAYFESPRQKTRPTLGSQRRRIEAKKIRGDIKKGRSKIDL